MRAVCFESIQNVSVREIADPTIEAATDAIVQVQVAGLCGSDLHPFFGRETGIEPGTVMGHEFVGNVVAVGSAVKNIQIDDRVCAPFTTSCGECFYCRSGLTSRCERGQLFGWREDASGLHGGQAEYVRVPLAEGTLMRVPDEMTNDTALLLGDNLSTGFYAADMGAIRSDGVCVVVGCGTVGLLAIACAFRLGAQSVIAIDPVTSRLQIAASLGAQAFADSEAASEAVMKATNGRGADSVMELVGLPQAQRVSIDLLRPGGTLSVIGCHCTPDFAFSPVEAYDKNLTYRTGRCPARHYMSVLADSISSQPMDLSWCMTHRFTLDDGVEAYDVFANRKDGCVKAVIDFA